MTPDPIRAAGAVLWRADQGIEVCLVHRPAYDDWSLPKGKLEGDEHPLVAALREVREETGHHAVPELRLPDVSYVLSDGSPKTVEFWAMRVDGTRPRVPVEDPEEVDRVDWVSPAEAARRLSYAADAELVDRVAALPPRTATTLLVRHARAGERKRWAGNDALRPIDEIGRRQAAGLAEVLAPFGPRRLVTANPLRCKQTLEPLAAAVDLPIVLDTAFAEPPDVADVPARVAAAESRLGELRDGEPTVICSQGKVIAPLLAAIAGSANPGPFRTPKGGGWVLSWSGGDLVAMSRL